MGYYPIFLEIKDTPCVVVGGGKVAGRKVMGLIKAGALVTVISPEVTEEIKALIDDNKARLLKRPYQAGDLLGACLVIAASSDRAVNELVLAEARAAHIPANVVDDPGGSDFIVPSAIQRRGLHIAVSTAGRSPALARRTRIEIEKTIGPEYGPFLEIIGGVRERLLKKGIKGDKKDRVINELLDSALLGLIKTGAMAKAGELVFEVTGYTLADLGLAIDKTAVSR